jgi:2-keto-3-deoxy-L-rhamnonate aldolase RhmA
MNLSTSLIPENHLKHKLQQGGSAVGTFVVEFRQPAVMQLLANAGFDFVLIDNEHGSFSIPSIAELSRTAVLLGITPIIRVPEIAYPYLAQTLDVGAQGLMIPRVTNPQQVRDVVRMLRYPPFGERGNAMERGLTRFRSGSVTQALEDIQRENMIIVQIETKSAFESLEEILAVDGLDAVLIGPNDLSISMGLPGQMDHPDVQAAIRRTIELCQRYDVFPAIHMGNLEMAVYWASQGMRMVSSGSEVSFINRAGQAVVKSIQSAFIPT